MPTIFTHIAIPIAARLASKKSSIPLSMLIVGMLCTIAPDFDGVSFKLGIPYGSLWGHRGITHTLLFAFCISLLGLFFPRTWKLKPWQCCLWLFVCTVSHPVLDMMTNGGKGIPFFWPLTEQRYFFPWRPIEVSPVTVDRFLSGRGLAVLLSEAKLIWLPCLACVILVAAYRKWRS